MTASPTRPAVLGVTFDYWDTIVAGVQGTGSTMRRLQIDRFAATLEAHGRSASDAD